MNIYVGNPSSDVSGENLRHLFLDLKERKTYVRIWRLMSAL